MIWPIFLVQAVTAAPQTLPDIELGARVRARSVTIEKEGKAELTVTTSPAGDNVVDVKAPKANGRRTLRNVEVGLKAEARIGEPAQAGSNIPKAAETSLPQRR